MKLVVQQDPKGCGVACVAMVTGKPYALVRKRAQLSGCWRPSYGMSGAMLQRLLDSMHWTVLGVTYRYTRMYTQLAIVKVNADLPPHSAISARRRFQHYVVWAQGKVYDPGPGIVWDGNGAIDGIDLYLANLDGTARTGRWYWL